MNRKSKLNNPTRAIWLLLLVSLGLALIAGYSQVTAAPAATFTVNNTLDAVDANPGDGVCGTAAGECTLRAAVMEANALTGDDTIALPAGSYLLTIAGAGEDAAATGDLDVTDNLIITGSGSAVTTIQGLVGTNTDRVWQVFSRATVAMSGVTISGGRVRGDSGAIYNQGTLTLAECQITGNVAYHPSLAKGGAIFNRGTATLFNCGLTGNQARGSALHGQSRGGAIYNSGRVTVENSSLLNNRAKGGNLADGIGGAFYNAGPLTIVNSTI